MAANYKYLTKSDTIFYVTYGTTTYADIESAWYEGKMIILSGTDSTTGSLYWLPASWGMSVGGNYFMFSGMPNPRTNGYFYCYTVDDGDNWSAQNLGVFLGTSDVYSTSLPYSSNTLIPCASAVTKYITENAVPRGITVSVSGYSALTQTTAPTATTLTFSPNFIHKGQAQSTYKRFHISLADFYKYYFQSIGSYNVNSANSGSTDLIMKCLRYYLPNIRVGIAGAGNSSKISEPAYFNTTSDTIARSQVTSAATSDGIYLRSTSTRAEIYIS